MVQALTSKVARTALIYALFCALALCVSNRARLALASEWRLAALRELELRGPDADVLFFGSSYTARGIVPAVFEQAWRARTGRELAALNLATMGLPRHIAYNELQSYLRRHAPPKLVCVELSMADLVEWPHALLSEFVLPEDALRVAGERPYAYPSPKAWTRAQRPPSETSALERWDPLGAFTAFHRAQTNLVLACDALGRGPEDVTRALWNRLANGLTGRGFANPYRRSSPEIPDIRPEDTAAQVAARGWYRVAPETELAIAGARGVEARAAQRSPEQWRAEREETYVEPGRYRAAKLYAGEIARVCRERGIALVFCELQAFLEPQLNAQMVAAHRALAPTFRPDQEPLQTPGTYSDVGHLNDRGAQIYTEQLVDWLLREELVPSR